MEKKTLIVNYAGLKTGGVEGYLGRLMTLCADEGHRVIWFTFPEALDSVAQPNIIDNPKIEKVFFAGGRRKFFKHPNFDLSADEDVVMISFTQEDYIWAEQFRYKYKCKSFYHHFILMNFFGWLTYPEDEFQSKFFSKRRAKFSNEIAKKLEQNDNIRAFADKQLTSYINRYCLGLKATNDKLLKNFPPRESITQEQIFSRAEQRKECFRIVSCARFQFPHKGYIFGLLDAFCELKKEYDNIKLIIIGDGENEPVYKKISEFPEYVKDSIELTGALPFDEVVRIFKQSQLAVGLAGSIRTSASLGVPSLVVRHDTLNCETYGLFQEANDTLLSETGAEIIPYIENIINCSNEKYVKIGMEGAEKYKAGLVIDPLYILKETNVISSPSVSKRDIRKNKIWAMISLSKKLFKDL